MSTAHLFDIRKGLILLWAFSFFGVLGILSPLRAVFLALTPVNLCVYLLLVIVSMKYLDARRAFALSIPFIIGMGAEMLGVNYGLIFGDYTYGSNMGPKVLGVPWMIGVNWMVLTYCTAALSMRLTDQRIISALSAAAIMVALDILMEVSAPRFDFWEFDSGIVPLQNYIGWFITAFVAHVIFQTIYRPSDSKTALHILAAIACFFGVFLFV
jgi:putative membrane protein